MSRAAYDLQVQATVHPANCGHPGFVPDDYLEHLDGLVRHRRGEDPHALAWEREREAKVQAHMAQPILVTPPRAVRGTPATRVELVAPGHVPAGWEQWPSTVQASILRQREPGQWYLLVKGVATYNGYGDPIDAARAGRIAWAFRPPLCFA